MVATVVKVRLQCPECTGKFYSKTATPDCCPLCGYEYIPTNDNVISMPSLRSAVSKTVDKVYRDAELASERRVEAAAAMAGVPTNEMQGLKMTNMRDNARVGENSAMEPQVSPEFQRHMELMKKHNAQVGFAGVESFAQTAHAGPDAHSGAFTLKRIQENLFGKRQ